MTIRRLPPEVAERIAAGEVIERPASVVKELVENALDAGARRVVVELEEGGRAAIRVRDDGQGIAPDELPLAVERHATSKLERFEDLERLGTLGFRGEALASVAAVARLTLESRPPGLEAGRRLRLRPGAEPLLEPVAMAPGTRVEVLDLFYNMPARRAHLRSPRAELLACEEVVSGHALARPQVAFRLLHEGRPLLETPGDGELRHVVAALWGEELAASLLPLEELWPPLGLHLSGLASPAGLGRASRTFQRVAVNGRPVENLALRMAAEEAYRNLLPLRHHPVLVLALELPPGEVDVNVHPAKRVVRFLRERAVHGAVHAALRRALEAGRRPRAASGGGAPAGGPPAAPERLREPAATWEWLELYAPAGAEAAAEEGAPPGALGPAREGAAGERESPGRLPPLRPLTQLHATYLLCLGGAEGAEELWLVDQHAADERYWFERLEGGAGAGLAQPLAVPASVALDRGRRAAWEARRSLLEALGFRAEPGGPASLWLRAVPAGVRGPEQLFAELLDEAEPAGAWEERLRAARARLACHAAVRAGDALAPPAQAALLARWSACRQPWTCPHGRPTAIRIGEEELARRFLRR